VDFISPGWIAVDEWQKSVGRKPPTLRTVDHAQHPVGRMAIIGYLEDFL
jgi:hypothetical protein